MSLNKREKMIVIAGALFLGVFLATRIIVTPIVDKKSRLERMLDVKKSALQEMIDLRTKYVDIKQKAATEREQLKQRDKDFRLFSFLDQLAHAAGIKDYISYMKPSVTVDKDTNKRISTVEMKIQDITMQELIGYVYRIETSKNMVGIGGLSISKAAKEKPFIDAVLKIDAYE